MNDQVKGLVREHVSSSWDVATPRSTAFSVALHISFSHRLISSVCNPSKKFPNRPRKVHAICTGLTCRYRGRTSWYCPSRDPANSHGSLSAQMALFRARSHIYMQKNVQKIFRGDPGIEPGTSSILVSIIMEGLDCRREMHVRVASSSHSHRHPKDTSYH
jgi:hypothetical protein